MKYSLEQQDQLYKITYLDNRIALLQCKILYLVKSNVTFSKINIVVKQVKELRKKYNEMLYVFNLSKQYQLEFEE